VLSGLSDATQFVHRRCPPSQSHSGSVRDGKTLGKLDWDWTLLHTAQYESILLAARKLPSRRHTDWPRGKRGQSNQTLWTMYKMDGLEMPETATKEKTQSVPSWCAWGRVTFMPN